MKTRLVRPRSGQTIHRSDCPNIQLPRRAYPWAWAENKSREEIELAAIRQGMKLCKMCNPLDGWNGPFHACTFRDGCPCVARCEAFDRHLAHQCCTR